MFDGPLNNPGAGAGHYVLSSWIFLRLLGVIYGIAFISLAVQIQGLAGRNGILPAAEFLEAEKKLWGPKRFLLLPTLCWWNCKDRFLQFLCWSGACLSLLLVAGVAPAPVLVLLWIFYLSIFTVMTLFLGYQWDILLLETGLLAIFLAPLEWWPHWPPADSPPALVRWLFYWLLFRLMFLSGFVKWRSGDAAWRNLTALIFHYETQPLPTPLSWYAHQLPAWFQKFSTVLMFVIELIVPFLIFGPLPLRYLAGITLIVFMVLIFLTGNYCFFNLNTILLCLLLFDDAVYLPLFKWLLGDDFAGRLHAARSTQHAAAWTHWILWPVAVLLLLQSFERLCRSFRLGGRWQVPLQKFYSWFEPFRMVGSYGLFSVMTTERLEIIIEGSQDGQSWRAYEFKWKPGALDQPPRWVAPHQPRLDWQMWFAALGEYRSNAWFVAFLIRLLQGAPEVLALLKTNPFANEPPRFVRAVLYEYHFTDFKTRRATRAWWKRERRWLYCPVFSLRGKEEQLMPPKDWGQG